MNRYYTYILLAFCLLSYSCAHELPLTGGDEDTKPPVVKKIEPANGSTNITSNKIVVEFDEFVNLKDASKQILISPPGTDFEALGKGKSIQLTIKSTLKPNTTYVVNFGSSIVDNNEGNVLAGLVYTFSTGAILDSLATSFVVVDAFTLKPVGNVNVMLYDQDVDSLPLTTVPYYAGITNENGQTLIGYMKPGKFKVFALTEENNNYLYDKSGEGIGYPDSLVEAGDTLPVRLVYFKEISTNSKIKTSKMPNAGMVNFKFTGPVEKTQLSIINNNDIYDTSRFEFIGTEKDSAVYWFKPQPGKDTLIWKFTRSKGETDTVKMSPKIINTFKNNIVTGSAAFKLTTSIPAEFDYYNKLRIEFSLPVDSMAMDKIIFKEEDKIIPLILVPTDSSKRKFILDYTFKQTKNYSIYIPKKSIKSWMGSYIDSTVVSFKTTNDKAYKVVTLKVANPEFNQGNGIYQLLNDKDEVLQQRSAPWNSDTTQVLFTNIRQGFYRVKLIYDTNANGKWDTGNYSEKKQPEKVSFFPTTIDIKPNFDYVLEWDIMKKD